MLRSDRCSNTDPLDSIVAMPPNQKLRKTPVLTAERAISDLGLRLTLARKVRLLTQADLAGQAGVGISTIAALESGGAGVAVGNLAKVLHALGLLSDIVRLADPTGDPAVVSFAESKLNRR